MNDSTENSWLNRLRTLLGGRSDGDENDGKATPAARPAGPRRNYANLSPRELSALLKSDKRLIVIDVREPWEYATGHVRGARLMPLGQLHLHLSKLDPKQPVAVICAHGNRSRSGAAQLVRHGLSEVYNVVGGTEAWRRAGLPVSRDQSK